MDDRQGDVLILGSSEVQALLTGRELPIIEVVKSAYENHFTGASALPHSTFLRFPSDSANRIIALPAYLGGEANCAGVKWIASFPGNLEHGMDRASAVLILNSAISGRPKAIMEASTISAKRTAASAALAAQWLGKGTSTAAGFVGCGPINFEIARFRLCACPNLKRLILFDVKPDRARAFREQCEQKLPSVEIEVAATPEDVFDSTTLISFGTSAGTPHVHRLSYQPGTVILHISLRDLSPELILSADNVVDDVDHVCRAHTSIHLAEQQCGNRGFIRCTLAEILTGSASPSRNRNGLTVFSPFGLGVLDIALAAYVFDHAVKQERGVLMPSFLPGPWTQLSATAAV